MEPFDYEEETPRNEWDSLVSLKLLTRNTHLVEARKAKGITQDEMGRAIRMSKVKLSNIENLRRVPSSAEQAEIAAYLCQSIDFLFPDILMKAIEEGVFARRDAQLTEPQIISLTEAARLQISYDGETAIIEECDRHLLSERISEVLTTLDPREEKVLKLRFGLEDGRSRILEEVGKEFGVTRERIRQIESKALRKLRHPRRARQLQAFLG